MNKLFLNLSALLLALLVFSVATAMAGGKHITFTEPKDGATVSSPVKVCMEAHGVTESQLKKASMKAKAIII